MAQHDQCDLIDAAHSYALISDTPTEALIIFVHGFWGDATTTWFDFQRLVDDARDIFPILHNSDLVFFDYPSNRWTIEVAAHNFLTFLRKVYPRIHESEFVSLKPATSILGLDSQALLPRRPPLEYKTLVLVGHSMGAAILRRALLLDLEGQLDRLRAGASLPQDSVLRAKLILFAPAHLGFKHSSLADTVAASHWAMATLRLLFQIRYAPSYPDLVAGSPVLTAIREHSERFAMEFPSAAALRARILWGADENVVYMGGFAQDFTEPPISLRDHVDVCKPSDYYRVPLEVLNGSARKADVSTPGVVHSEFLSPRASGDDRS